MIIFPPREDEKNLHPFEQAPHFSVWVLVRMKRWQKPSIFVARYSYTLGEWSVIGLAGGGWSEDVVEWWPIPAEGSGVNVVEGL